MREAVRPAEAAGRAGLLFIARAHARATSGPPRPGRRSNLAPIPFFPDAARGAEARTLAVRDLGKV